MNEEEPRPIGPELGSNMGRVADRLEATWLRIRPELRPARLIPFLIEPLSELAILGHRGPSSLEWLVLGRRPWIMVRDSFDTYSATEELVGPIDLQGSHGLGGFDGYYYGPPPVTEKYQGLRYDSHHYTVSLDTEYNKSRWLRAKGKSVKSRWLRAKGKSVKFYPGNPDVHYGSGMDLVMRIPYYIDGRFTLNWDWLLVNPGSTMELRINVLRVVEPRQTVLVDTFLIYYEDNPWLGERWLYGTEENGPDHRSGDNPRYSEIRPSNPAIFHIERNRWHTLKFGGDTKTGRYLYMMLDGRRFDLSQKKSGSYRRSWAPWMDNLLGDDVMIELWMETGNYNHEQEGENTLAYVDNLLFAGWE